ncbi:Transposase and inactivated derivatives [uncultured Candidatus Thioglobus sp.]|nr:Transposase and inactivated derivatives [uncultured Candidatus Thioglobus sp.]
MARLAIVSPVGVPQRIVQRGNNRQVCFGGEEDMKAYLNWLTEYSIKHGVGIHAWVLMTNHVHRLCTPQSEGVVSKMMQSIGRMLCSILQLYLSAPRYTLGGSVQSERYLLELHRYIELNSVRAGMVEEPSEYTWSSYGCNGLDIETKLQTAHKLYLALGKTKQQRLLNYRALFKVHVGVELLTEIRDSLNKRLALGSERFTTQIEALTNRRITPRKAERPKKSESKS